MNTVEAFRANQAALESSLENAATMEEAGTALRIAFERTAATLAQNETDEITRQREQAVLSVAKQSSIFLKGVRADGQLVSVSQPETTESARKMDSRQIAMYSGLIILACLAVYELISGKWVFTLLAIIAVLLMVLGRDRTQQTESLPKWRAEGVARIDTEATVRSMEELCHAVDIAVSDLSIIDREQSVKTLGSREDAMLDFMSSLLEAKESGRDDLLMDTVGDVEQFLHRLGIQAVRYSPDQSAMFDLLPTLGEARTVRPALVSGEHILRRGVAAIRMQEVGR